MLGYSAWYEPTKNAYVEQLGCLEIWSKRQMRSLIWAVLSAPVFSRCGIYIYIFIYIYRCQRGRDLGSMTGCACASMSFQNWPRYKTLFALEAAQVMKSENMAPIQKATYAAWVLVLQTTKRWRSVSWKVQLF